MAAYQIGAGQKSRSDFFNNSCFELRLQRKNRSKVALNFGFRNILAKFGRNMCSRKQPFSNFI